MLRNVCLVTLLAPALAAQALPTGEAVMERFIQATGGKAAMDAKRSMVVKGTMELAAMGLKGAVTIHKAAPNLSRTEVDLPGIGKMLEGFDGSVAWSFSAMQGPQIKTGAEHDVTAQEARFNAQNWKELYRSLETLGVASVDGEPCHHLKVTPHKGPESHQYFSVATGLLVKMAMKLPTAMGEVPVEARTQDYRKVGDVLVAHKLVQQVAGQSIILTFQSVAWDQPLAKGLFDPPAEVKALMKPAAK